MISEDRMNHRMRVHRGVCPLVLLLSLAAFGQNSKHTVQERLGYPATARLLVIHADDLGIHLALNSEWTPYRWGPVSPRDKVPSLLDEQGYMPLLETTVAQQAKPSEVETELRAQIERARAFKIPLTHFDTHMGALTRTPELVNVYWRMGREYNLPILMERAEGAHH